MLEDRLYAYYQAVDDSKTGKATTEDVLAFFSPELIAYKHQGYGGVTWMHSLQDVMAFIKQTESLFCGICQHNITNVRLLGNVTTCKGTEYNSVRVDGAPRSVQIIFQTTIEWHTVGEGKIWSSKWKIQRMDTVTTRIYLDAPSTVLL